MSVCQMNTCDSTLCMYRNMFSHAYTWGVFNVIRSTQQIESMGELTEQIHSRINQK